MPQELYVLMRQGYELVTNRAREIRKAIRPNRLPYRSASVRKIGFVKRVCVSEVVMRRALSVIQQKARSTPSSVTQSIDTPVVGMHYGLERLFDIAC